MRTMPLFPTPTEWVAPETFPNLSTAKEIAIDLETCDPNLESFGPGWPRSDGFIVGYAIAVDGWSGYYPVAHAGGGNLDKRRVETWIKDVLATPADKIMHNAAYDAGWLGASGFTINGRILDTMLAAPLLMRTDSPSASTRSASTTSKRSRVSRASSRPQPISVSILKRNSGSSQRCMSVSTRSKTRR
jgi:hypothetical protein